MVRRIQIDVLDYSFGVENISITINKRPKNKRPKKQTTQKTNTQKTNDPINKRPHSQKNKVQKNPSMIMCELDPFA